MAKTKEGVVNIHGKEYKTVALRVAEFREVCPDWSIVTDLVAETDDKVIMKASISHLGVVLGTGYAEEVRSASRINKTSALENAETLPLVALLRPVVTEGLSMPVRTRWQTLSQTKISLKLWRR